ncbi:hypothetical protein ABF87_11930 [Nitrosomonas sp. JL21]|uniref:hypothetical protein n=1 Tax=Nitrosomonas sp. JL21 TaxID=153949 RepID=UPI0013718615|nr:hypothetical protein [Nitrosomonas sp. JL21]MBL8498514.1 hypothetical protein [Nitrosomonas sp.]MXS78651.1 hypothetical protein [Nitrosomonas sp. JL21]
MILWESCARVPLSAQPIALTTIILAGQADTNVQSMFDESIEMSLNCGLDSTVLAGLTETGLESIIFSG